MIKTYFINSTVALYDDSDLASLQTSLFEKGIVASSAGVLGFAVVQQASPNMSVQVAVGKALVEITKSGKTFKVFVENDANVNVTIPANSSGANRVGAVVLRVSVATEPNITKSNIATLEYIPGTSTSPLSDGAITTALGSDGWIRLADITVANADTSITTSEIADTRIKSKTNQSFTLSPEVISFSVLASDPASPVEGQFWYNSTTHTLKYRDNSTTYSVQSSMSTASSAGLADQSQTTQNATEVVGEANTTLKKNKLAQSFIPTKTKIRGARLYKIANSGSFTGTVTVSLQADSSGSPSGSDLASGVLSNAVYNALPVGEFEVLFASEYASIVAGNLYWIVITISTADNTNHPNLGTNSAGGYASGSVKYWNTTDGWLADGTIDLYFKSLEGNKGQIVQADPSTGKINDSLLNNKMRDRVYIQTGTIGGGSASGNTAVNHALGAIPSFVRVTTFVMGTSPNAGDRLLAVGTAKISNDGQTITYNTMNSMQGSTNGYNSTGGSSSYLMEYNYGGMGTQRFTLGAITNASLNLVNTLTSSPGSTTLGYIIEVYY